MPQSEHTPGPWIAHDWRVVDTQGTDGICTKVICDTANNKATRTTENRANARLIAAAPELLKALQRYVDHFGDPLKCARAAIHKATGGDLKASPHGEVLHDPLRQESFDCPVAPEEQ